ncbi:hypothetical protein Rhe02_71970 [Rhizocola hellebori]|uniref:Uncharacterized protein n=1 Tax=Rhizocola hellebori TaxID=1392758 RepID=A0A8J3VJW2_9ACTN|nr:hypothetical protein Rhe02_71970 [Rhizocola hellebori]
MCRRRPHARVVDEHVDASGTGQRRLDEALPIAVDAHVAGHYQRPLAQLGGQFTQILFVPRRQHELGAGGMQHTGETHP